MVENLETGSSQLTKPSQRELKIQDMVMEVTREVGEGVMVEEIGQQQDKMIASNVADQDIGHETVHQLVVVEVLVHSRLHVPSMVVLLDAGIAMQMIVIGTWMIDMTEVVMVIEIVMTTEMIDMGVVVIDMRMTGIPLLETALLLKGMPLLLSVTPITDMGKTELTIKMLDPEVLVIDMVAVGLHVMMEKATGRGQLRTTVLGGEGGRHRWSDTEQSRAFSTILTVSVRSTFVAFSFLLTLP